MDEEGRGRRGEHLFYDLCRSSPSARMAAAASCTHDWAQRRARTYRRWRWWRSSTDAILVLQLMRLALHHVDNLRRRPLQQGPQEVDASASHRQPICRRLLLLVVRRCHAGQR